MKSSNTKVQEGNKYKSLIDTRIENIRPKLLDLTKRNPLLSTNFTGKTISNIRVVDELPQHLFERLLKEPMQLVPLPPLEDDPKDEKTREFKNALANSLLTDEEYLAKLEQIDENDVSAPEKTALAERELKDKIRLELGLPERQTKTNLSLVQHAKNHKINPSYELPSPQEKHEDGRHTDDKIQTLLLQEILNRYLDNLITKERTWKQEAGINVLRIAFGFLEWQDDKSSKPSYAPLLLLPLAIEKRKTGDGYQYWVNGSEESFETNATLAEMLLHDFGITVPAVEIDPEDDFDKTRGFDLEGYFKKLANVTPKQLSWRIRRQIAIGVFPSARMAMYHDLDTSKWDFSEGDIISSLLAGSDAIGDAAPFGDDYHIDSPEIEQKVPLLVMDSDSSQFSTIVDVADGKNVAVEGPPGTGKSQTIINTIAAALSKGKSILFVAEKTAALEVVKSRLEACGLGEFLLPLQANRSSKEQVIQSIRERIVAPTSKPPNDYDGLITSFRKKRDEIQIYIEILSQVFGNTGKTVYEILGESIATRKFLTGLPGSLTHENVPKIKSLNQQDIDELLHQAAIAEQTWQAVQSCSTHWQAVGYGNLDPITVDKIVHTAKACSDAYISAFTQRQALECFALSSKIDSGLLENLIKALKIAETIEHQQFAHLILQLSESYKLGKIKQFLETAETARHLQAKLAEHFVNPLDETLPEDLNRLHELAKQTELLNILNDGYQTLLSSKAELISSVQKTIELIRKTTQANMPVNNAAIASIALACRIVQVFDPDILARRDDRLDSSACKDLLEKAASKRSDLLRARESLKDCFLLNSLPEVEELKKYAEVLSSAHIFSFMQLTYHRAKAFYLSISKCRVFSPRQASIEMKELIEWLIEEKKFSEDDRLRSLLGIDFEGLETNFKPYLAVLNYYSRVDAELSGVSNAELRSYLKTANRDALMSLPSPTGDTCSELTSMTLAQAEAFLFEQIENQQKLEECFSEITRLGQKAFKKTHFSYPVEQIEKFQCEVTKLQQLWRSTRDNGDARTILGSFYRGADTNQQDLEDAIRLAKVGTSLEQAIKPAFLRAVEELKTHELIGVLSSILSADKEAESLLTVLESITGINYHKLFSGLERDTISNQLSAASKDKEGLLIYSQFLAIREKFNKVGLNKLLAHSTQARSGLQDFEKVLKAYIVQALSNAVYQEYGEILKHYNGSTLDSCRKQLAQLDRDIIACSRKKLRYQLLINANPPTGNGQGKKSTYTEMCLLKNEAGKKTRYLSPRELTKRAGKALLAIKPCWMMSPLAVAQYIPKDSIRFDLVIIDEASQMTPENAIGALARGGQSMIVGDTNQLPPSNFFKKVLDDNSDEDEAVSEESILEMANTIFRPARRLRWHYRSKHSALIAFSNRYVYDNDLVVFPSPSEHDKTMGVSYVKVDGIYSSQTNPIEAKVIIDAVLTFMRNHADRSLGVVVLNQKQRDLLLQEWEFALSKNQTAARYVERWEKDRDGLEAFFIKNLENVQGDERDVILIGTVYGPEQLGSRVNQRFGPINGITGKRRLNVLFSRAKKQIVTFSSMTSTDILADEDSNPGTYLLKKWLEYSASRGEIELGEVTRREPDSIFEEYVIEQIKAMGCEPIPQVGVAGYFIDIGVRHPGWPHGFMLGVECDGASYHSAKSARDRDRLREEVLTGQGWKLHRIWSTDWFADPNRQATLLREAIHQRLEELKNTYSNSREHSSQNLRKVIMNVPDPNLNGREQVVNLVQRSRIKTQVEPNQTFDYALLKEDHKEESWEDASLSRNVFTRFDLEAANFDGSDLEEADFRGANLKSASFRGANLYQTDFSQTNLCGADLSTAKIYLTDFQDAWYDSCTQFPSGFDPEKQKMKHIVQSN